MGDQNARDETIGVGKLVLFTAILGPTLGVFRYLLQANAAPSIGLLTSCLRSTLTTAIALVIVTAVAGRRRGFVFWWAGQSIGFAMTFARSWEGEVLRTIGMSLIAGAMLRLLYMIPAFNSRHPTKLKDAPTASASAVGGIWDRDLDG